MSIICIEWKTDVMPVSAYDYYHADCWHASSHAQPNARTREVTGETPANCAECSQSLNGEKPEEREHDDK